MQKLAVLLGVLLVVLIGITPLAVRAGDEPETRVTGTRTASTGNNLGFADAQRGTAKWEAVVGEECKIVNRTLSTPLLKVQATGTVQLGTAAAPSDHLTCHINASNIAAIPVGSNLCVYVNFSGGSSTTPAFDVNCPQEILASRTFQARTDNTGNSVTFAITELEVEAGDD